MRQHANDQSAFIVQEQEVAVERGEAEEDPGVTWRTLLSADRTPTAEVTAGTCEIAPGGELGFHHHPVLEVYYFLEGEGVVRLGERTVPVSAGATLSIPANLPHGIRNTGSVRLKLFYVFPTDSFSDVEYTSMTR